ncbi:MAG: bifunctional protein FolD [Porticoccaceae bacterium]|nr:MAG: bifunctional protein FolD [Porticoccaceae bacterium]
MAAVRIDGKAHADELCARLAKEVAELAAKGVVPAIAVILVGEDPASQVYVRNKVRRAAELGIRSLEHRLPVSVSQEALLELVDRLNRDAEVHGILVQLPLPEHVDPQAVIDAIRPEKDVDGFTVQNAGRLAVGQPALVPCTPLGCLMLLKAHLGSLEGLEAVVVGRSNIVGKPMAQLLLRENCTVTIAHSKTRDLPRVCRRGDILVAAVGRPRFIRGDWIKPGATVIDVGINRISEGGGSRLVGDVDEASAARVAGAITPVPGGVGPMTIACLMYNTVAAARAQSGL